MNLDDESLLSAYLDDELDPAERLAVEWSIESSPPLADQLRSLATARDAVSGLSRPPIPTGRLASTVVSRLTADRRRARVRAMARPGRVAIALAGLSAMAASLLFALILLHRATHDSPEIATVVQQIPQAPVSSHHLIEHTASDRAPAKSHRDETNPILPPDETNPILGRSSPANPDARLELVASPAEVREREDRARVTRMLEQPDVRLVLVLTDVIDAAGRVQSLIEKDARKNPEFGRITLRAGIVVDPNRPGSAEVFAVPTTEGGQQSFLDRLRGEFTELKDEGEPSPELVTQLSEIGHVAIFEGDHASPLGKPPGEVQPFIAIRPADPVPDQFTSTRIVPIDEMDPDPPAAGRPASPSLHPPGPSKIKTAGGSRSFIGPPWAPDPERPVTLLVWVARPPRR